MDLFLQCNSSPKKGFTHRLEEKSTHISRLNLGDHYSTACGTSACWTHTLEPFPLVPI